MIKTLKHIRFWSFVFVAVILVCSDLQVKAQRISMGSGNVFYICDDSTITAIGNNSNFQLGDGTNTERHYPVKVKGLKNVVAINGYGALALLSDGTVWQWAKSNTGPAQPYLAKIPIENVISIAAGDQPNGGMFYCAVKNDGTLWLWGDRTELSPIDWGYKDSLEQMTNLPKIKKVQGGFYGVIALSENGDVYTWGDEGMEGNGNLITYPNFQIRKPQKVNLLSNIKDVATGGIYATAWALDKKGDVWEWGSGRYKFPVKINISNADAIFTTNAANSDAFYALKNNGALLFFKNYAADSTKIDTIFNVGNITTVCSWGSGSLGIPSTYLTNDLNQIYRWGDNSSGQLGNLTTFALIRPAKMVNPCVSVICDNKNQETQMLDTTVIAIQPVSLKASPSNANLYWWYPEDNILLGKNRQEASVQISDDTQFFAVIMDSNGCMRKESFILRKKCGPQLIIAMDTVIIPGAKLTLKANPGTGYVWSPNSGVSCDTCSITTVTMKDPNTLYVTYQDIFTCQVEEDFIINFPDCDTIILNPIVVKLDTTIFYASNILLPASVSYDGYAWNPLAGLNCTDCQAPYIYVKENTEVQVTLFDKWFCPFIEAFKINFIGTEIFIPNVFTPNNDGVNDLFEVKGLISPSTLKIFNNKGIEVYRSDDYQNTWNGNDSNGTKLIEGTYWYVLTIPYAGEFKGWVYLKN